MAYVHQNTLASFDSNGIFGIGIEKVWYIHKGNLLGLQEVVVKILLRRTDQGLEEFKNEISLIAKLQHRNLFRLLGYCIQEKENMFYEYKPNKIFDFFLFNPSKQSLLDWRKHFDIIEGIARRVFYVNQDSRLRKIPCDLKRSNILLNGHMTPQISELGMEIIFGMSQNEAYTTRVVGTYSYMSPEYAMEDLFSVKAVYSFAVELLEIVSGRRNNGLRSSEHSSFI
ncbi:hypothetical protein PRUPE_6G144500 [Prunus persica]|uniref:non-specific serine/threonine protein kinase n=1 Tax=Prunus persica TaxID=3760 RepID=M5WMF0_PRUPE|nr:hypothetical protein PRUPE_6G144500 [Prunus persica]